jgi:hypothetical protein
LGSPHALLFTNAIDGAIGFVLFSNVDLSQRMD